VTTVTHCDLFIDMDDVIDNGIIVLQLG